MSKLTKILSILSLTCLPIAVSADYNDARTGGIMALIMGIGVSFWLVWMLFVGIMMIVNILGIILWIWMLVDVAKRDFKQENDKLLWILVVVLAGWIGAAIYYFMVKRKDPSISSGQEINNNK